MGVAVLSAGLGGGGGGVAVGGGVAGIFCALRVFCAPVSTAKKNIYII
jgi:hypothetical protein